MSEPVIIGDATLYLGDCTDVLRTLGDASVDSIVCDPPYHLTQVSRGGHARTNNPDMPHGRHRIGDKGFMGKVWDGGDIAHRVETWAECLRVLKPGGHMLAFAGSRTYHRMTCAIEDAGFDIRDQIMWIYGGGFPKSLDVSKAIDKAGPSARAPFAEFAAHYERCRKASGLTHAQICEIGKWYGSVNHGGASANWANGYGVPTSEQWTVLEPLLSLDPEWRDFAREEFEREVIGARKVSRGVAFNSDGPDEIAVTAPGSDAARQWHGWGTAIKPSHEPICMARKPLFGTVASNVLRFGTGALNIDGCRVPSGADHAEKCASVVGLASNRNGNAYGEWTSEREDSYSPLGRWPANIIHDGLTEEWSRFFYCAKASRADRNEGIGGSDMPAVSTEATMRDRETADWQERNGNHHPTVKPTDLMAYLCRLVTPPGGTVLDCFMGSGSTGKAAMREGFKFIGIDMTPEYVAIAEARIKFEFERVEQERIDAARQIDMFSEIA